MRAAEARAFARAATYRLLGASLAYPTPDALRTLARAVPPAVTARRHIDPAARGPLIRVAAATRDLSASAAESAYLRAFGHAGAPRALQYEAPYTSTNLFQETSVLADVSGYYGAFGVGAAGERADHIALELEFMHLLCFKEGYARRHDGSEAVAVCADAQRSFLASHLGRWAVPFFRLLRADAAGTHLALVAELGEAFCAAEAARGGAVMAGPAARVAPDDDGAWSCPLAPGMPA